jgi:hypothetical protein
LHFLGKVSSRVKPRFATLSVSSRFCFSFRESSLLEARKLTRKDGLSMFFTAKVASVGMLEESLMIFDGQLFQCCSHGLGFPCRFILVILQRGDFGHVIGFIGEQVLQ